MIAKTNNGEKSEKIVGLLILIAQKKDFDAFLKQRIFGSFS